MDEIRTNIPVAKSAKEWELYRNYRLPLPVARYVQHIGVNLGPFIETTYRSTERELPRIIRYESKEKQFEAIHRIINKDLDDVAILLPNAKMVMQAYNSLTNLGINCELKYDEKPNYKNSRDNLNFNSTNPKIMTYHSAKGLQFETVFVPCLEDFIADGGSNQKALYVAMTRTYKNLYVLYSGTLPSPLSNIDPNLFKTSEIDIVDDI